MDAVTWLSTAAFRALGAYVGIVTALFFGCISLAWTVAAGLMRVPFIFVDAVSSVYSEGARAPQPPPPRMRMRKKLAAPPPEVAGAPAGGAASYGYGYGQGGDRGLLG